MQTEYNNRTKSGCPLNFLLDGKVSVDILHKRGSQNVSYSFEMNKS